jgi:signal transduction histidine kinase
MRSVLNRLGSDTRYLLAGFPTAVIGFALLVTGFSLGVGLLVTGLGLIILAGTLLVARGFGELERRHLAEVLGSPVAHPRYKYANPGMNAYRRAINPVTNGQSWLDLLHGIVVFPFAIATFVVTVVWWLIAIAGLLFPLYGWIIDRIPGNRDLPDLLGFPDNLLVSTLFHFAGGVFFALTLPFIVRGAALLRAGVGSALLTSMAEMQGRLNAAVSAEAASLRKIERDIHDGPQQRLVRLAMELTRAKRQLVRDPEAAQSTLDQAIQQTRETLDELRTLSRGIAPPVLTDRGLAPALAALSERSTVPIELDLRTEERYPPAVENAVYFAAAESLANIAKHSEATIATITLQRVDGKLTMTIGDDGVGGAHVAKGHGLAGLADRMHSVNGELAVHSPAGGPTVIGVEVPCEL